MHRTAIAAALLVLHLALAARADPPSGAAPRRTVAAPAAALRDDCGGTPAAPGPHLPEGIGPLATVVGVALVVGAVVFLIAHHADVRDVPPVRLPAR